LNRSPRKYFALGPIGLKKLAHGVQALKETELDFQEKMGRRFILCSAEVDTDKNLAALIELAKKHPQNIVESLKLIRLLQIDKSAALPFVLQQIDPEILTKQHGRKTTTTDLEWQQRNAAYHALRAFRSPKAAEGILQFIRSTDDTYMVQGAITALSTMTLSEQFEQLAGIADQVAASSDSAYYLYLDLLIRDSFRPSKGNSATQRSSHPTSQVCKSHYGGPRTQRPDGGTDYSNFTLPHLQGY